MMGNLHKNKQTFTTVEEVYDKALDLLALRDYGGDDMYEKLLLKGASSEQAREVVKRLQQEDLINERRYGFAVYRGWLNKRCYGRQHLIGTLTKKLVAKSVWDEILEQFTEELEEQHAREAADLFYMKYKNKKFPDKRKLWSTAAGFMVSRGFGSGYMELVLERFNSVPENF